MEGVSLESLLALYFYRIDKNIVLYGSIETGKTMLSILIGMSTCNQDVPMKFDWVAGLINLFSESQ
ncbi:ATP-binding protein [Lachnoanaerobaculum saburreum]